MSDFSNRKLHIVFALECDGTVSTQDRVDLDNASVERLRAWANNLKPNVKNSGLSALLGIGQTTAGIVHSNSPLSTETARVLGRVLKLRPSADTRLNPYAGGIYIKENFLTGHSNPNHHVAVLIANRAVISANLIAFEDRAKLKAGALQKLFSSMKAGQAVHAAVDRSLGGSRRPMDSIAALGIALDHRTRDGNINVTAELV